MKIFVLYQLLFPNGKRYVGLSCQPKTRFAEHRRIARLMDKGVCPVHRAIAKYGWDSIDVKIIDSGSREYIAEREIFEILLGELTDGRYGYNVSFGGDISPTLNPETARRGGLKRRGIPKSAEHRAKISASLMGHGHTVEARAKIGAAFMGRKLTVEHRAKIAAAGIGRTHTQESKQKMSANMRGKIVSTETRAKLSAAITGRKVGPQSDATKQKISNANRAAWARRKGLSL